MWTVEATHLARWKHTSTCIIYVCWCITASGCNLQKTRAWKMACREDWHYPKHTKMCTDSQKRCIEENSIKNNSSYSLKPPTLMSNINIYYVDRLAFGSVISSIWTTLAFWVLPLFLWFYLNSKHTLGCKHADIFSSPAVQLLVICTVHLMPVRNKLTGCSPDIFARVFGLLSAGLNQSEQKCR